MTDHMEQNRKNSLMKQLALLLLMILAGQSPALAQSDKVYEAVEQMPSFPEISVVTQLKDAEGRVLSENATTISGQTALMRYMSEALKYPVVALENGVSGRVICTFVVEKDGTVADVQVVRGVDNSLDKEAVRVLSNMPRWQPGKLNGKEVRVKYTVPVTFKL